MSAKVLLLLFNFFKKKISEEFNKFEFVLTVLFIEIDVKLFVEKLIVDEKSVLFTKKLKLVSVSLIVLLFSLKSTGNNLLILKNFVTGANVIE